MVIINKLDKKDYTTREINNSPNDINKYKDYQKVNVTE
jgi:hypothetical protein